MAFNFNWSPLMADTWRARDMLTTALNKSLKPPIIVDDIVVTELNMGSTPPELEILEVGDLAEDRFRGIFRMSYSGDAFLTLKTKVQANPLKTYLSAQPDFASPQPLAASSGLTIPLQITLSDIRLSGFVILVFSKQKGLTLVFRNDPLESLKVSSTFDSIPFVRDYLQKEIEGQLRILFMEDLPAIIHRLSLRLWSTEYQELETEEKARRDRDATVPVHPLATPPQDAVDTFGNPLNESQISSLSLDSSSSSSSEVHASFSQKNSLRLAALSESQHTLSLFTPSIRDAVFRAWAGRSDRLESGAATPAWTQGSLSRMQSTLGSVNSTASSIASDSTGNESRSSRPSISHSTSMSGSLNLGANRSRTSGTRKPKKRVIDLRKKNETGGEALDTGNALHTSQLSDTSSVVPEEGKTEEVAATPPRSPPGSGIGLEDKYSSTGGSESSRLPKDSSAAECLVPAATVTPGSSSTKVKSSSKCPAPLHSQLGKAQQATSPLLHSLSFDKTTPLLPHGIESSSTSAGILEQAWMLKMSQDNARKGQQDKNRSRRAEAVFRPSQGRSMTSPLSFKGAWTAPLSEDDMDAPPAYVA